MPILSAETDVFPEDLLIDQNTVLTSDRRWWAVYTRSRQEKHLMRELIAREIACYCPTVSHQFRSPNGRLRTSYLPLFANYLFLYGDDDCRYRALQTNLISKTIEVEDGIELVRDLRQIQHLIQLGLPLPIETRMQPGQKVRIRTGRLQGVEGIVLKRQGESYLFVAVNFLQQGALIKLEDQDVESAQ